MGIVRSALSDRQNKLPLRCETCRAGAAGGAGGAELPLLAPASLQPLVALSRALVHDPSCPPLRQEELQLLEEEHAAMQGLLARCPRSDCGAGTVLAPGAPMRVECRSCAQPMCRQCCVPWHDGLSCTQHVTAQLEALRATDGPTAAFLRTRVARCPTPDCGAMLGMHERGHRCHHISCERCEAHYCCVCGSEWRGGCSGPSRCALFCDDRCTCPDCVVCRPGAQCGLCDNDGRCRSCQPAARGRRRNGHFFG